MYFKKDKMDKWEQYSCTMYTPCSVCGKWPQYMLPYMCEECGKLFCNDCKHHMAFDKPIETDFVDEEDQQLYLEWEGYSYCKECVSDEEYIMKIKTNNENDNTIQEWFNKALKDCNGNYEIKCTVIVKTRNGSTKTIKGKIVEIKQENVES